MNLRSVAATSLATLAGLWLPVLGIAGGPSEEPDWAGIHQSAENYFSFPSGTNARQLIGTLPKGDHGGDLKGKEDFDFIQGHMPMLERQVVARDPDALKLAFALRSVADGSLLEDLDILIGQVIRIDPGLFLRELKISSTPERALQGILGNLGPYYVDLEDAQCYELGLRIKALQSVRSPDLIHLKASTLSVLRREASSQCDGTTRDE